MEHPGQNEIIPWEKLTAFKFGKPDQIALLEQEQQSLHWALEGRSEGDGSSLDVVRDRMVRQGMQPMTVDPRMLRMSLDRIQQSLQNMRPPTGLSQIQLSRYLKQRNDLKEEIRTSMPSVEMMNRGNDADVQWNMGWQAVNAPKAVAAANIDEILRANCDPTNSDPFFSSVETMRPVEPPKVDPRKFKQNWEHLRFTETLERELSKPDEMAYLQFCRYKSLDWSQASIMKEAGLTPAAYEACMDRWQAEKARHEGSLTVEMVKEEDQPEIVLAQAFPQPKAAVPKLDDPPQNWKDQGPWLRAHIDARGIMKAAFSRASGLTPGAPLYNYFRGAIRIPEELLLKMMVIIDSYDDDPTSIEPFMVPPQTRGTAPPADPDVETKEEPAGAPIPDRLDAAIAYTPSVQQ